jgi:hypothetical protein
VYDDTGLPEPCAAVHLHVLGLLGWCLTGLHGSRGSATCAQNLLLGRHVLRDCYMSRADAKFDTRWPADANATQEGKRQQCSSCLDRCPGPFRGHCALQLHWRSRPLKGMLCLLCPLKSELSLAERGCGSAIPPDGLPTSGTCAHGFVERLL